LFVKNDLSPEKLFFNGKIGMVEAFEEDTIIVKCPEDEYPVFVEMAERQNMRYTLDEDTKELDETVIGTFTQFPLRLGHFEGDGDLKMGLVKEFLGEKVSWGDIRFVKGHLIYLICTKLTS
jgi:hypothetical protein